MDTAAPASIAPTDPRLARCAFAKLQGEGLEYFVRKYEVTMGRTSKNSTLDLILGDSTTISRQHATIRYNFDNKCFELVVLGKNGVQVESRGEAHVYTPDSPPTPLRSRDLLVMGEKKFYFLLPRTMGGPARKRRRVEASPAPQTVAAAVPGPSTGAAPMPQVPPAPAAQPAVQAPHHQQQPQAAPVAAQPHPVAAATAPDVPQAQPQPQQPAAALQPHGLSSHPVPPQQHPQQHPQQQPLPHEAPGQQVNREPSHLFPGGDAGLGVAAGVGDLVGPEHQQFEEDTLMSPGADLVYDNGAPYGYGGDPNGFGAGF